MSLGRIALLGPRLWVALRHAAVPLASVLPWLARSRENTNFTYDLTQRNRRHLAAAIASVLGRPYGEIRGYLDEIEGDAALRAHVASRTDASPQRYKMDREARYGRRIGWYAFARALKPALVVETGVDKGLGACVLAAALLRNAAEGSPGRYCGTDINPAAGTLFTGPYRATGEIRYGDSLETLRSLDGPIGLFINDSDHSADYEAREYRAVEGKMAPEGILLADNAHGSDALLEFALATGRSFLFFAERPQAHWYPGAGIGIAWKPQAGRKL